MSHGAPLLATVRALAPRFVDGIRAQLRRSAFDARVEPVDGLPLVIPQYADAKGEAVWMLERDLFLAGCSTKRTTAGIVVRSREVPPEDLDARLAWATDRQLFWEAKHPVVGGCPDPKGPMGPERGAAWKREQELQEKAGAWAENVETERRGTALLNVLAGLETVEQRVLAIRCLRAIAASPTWPETLSDSAARALVELARGALGAAPKQVALGEQKAANQAA